MPRLSDKTSGLDPLPNNPFTLTPVQPAMRLSGDKGDLVFKQIASQTVFQNELSRELKFHYISKNQGTLSIKKSCGRRIKTIEMLAFYITNFLKVKNNM